MLINFVLVNLAPGGPINTIIASNHNIDDRFSLSSLDTNSFGNNSHHALPPDLLKQLNQQFGFDKTLWQRFKLMLTNYMQLDFGNSYFKNESVINLIADRLIVSLSLALPSALLIYLIGIPLGIWQMSRKNIVVNEISTIALIILYSIPSFIIALLLILLFATGNYWQLFPLRGLMSDNWYELGLLAKIKDYIWHLILPVSSLVLGHIAKITLLTKNTFGEELHQPYVLAAIAKGVNRFSLLFKHIFRNALLPILATLPTQLMHLIVISTLLIEIFFSIDGIGSLCLDAALTRDYPVIFGTIFIFAFIGMFIQLIVDLIYMKADPRINLTENLNQ